MTGRELQTVDERSRTERKAIRPLVVTPFVDSNQRNVPSQQQSESLVHPAEAEVTRRQSDHHCIRLLRRDASKILQRFILQEQQWP